MVHVIRTLSLATVLPLVSGAAAAAVCHPVHHHPVHLQKSAVHHSAGTGVGVSIDQARLVSFPKPVKTVFVGNSTIADVSMIDSEHAFVLGKTFGVTNLIALGMDGNPISNQQVTVLNNGTAVTVNRGADQFNYMCTNAHCETAPRPGDQKTFVDNTESSATTHENAANSAGTNVQSQSASN